MRVVISPTRPLPRAVSLSRYRKTGRFRVSARSQPKDSASAVLPAADVAGEHEQRRPVGEQRQGGQVAPWCSAAHALQPPRVGEQLSLPAQPVLDVVDARPADGTVRRGPAPAAR